MAYTTIRVSYRRLVATTAAARGASRFHRSVFRAVGTTDHAVGTAVDTPRTRGRRRASTGCAPQRRESHFLHANPLYRQEFHLQPIHLVAAVAFGVDHVPHAVLVVAKIRHILAHILPLAVRADAPDRETHLALQVGNLAI